MEGALGSFQSSGRENVRGRYERSCQVPVCLPLPFAPPFFPVHLFKPKPPRHTLLGLREGEVTWLGVQPSWAGDGNVFKGMLRSWGLLKLVVDQGKFCEHTLGNPELHHAPRSTNRVKCQRLSCGLVLFARFGLFLALPLSPSPLEFA